MGILIVLVFFVLSSWTLVALFRRLRRQQVSRACWAAFGSLAACGVVLGIWCAFHLEYHVGSRYRVASFPIPACFFHLENGEWVDFPVAGFQAWLSLVTNVITIAALATLPLWLVIRRQHNPS